MKMIQSLLSYLYPPSNPRPVPALPYVGRAHTMPEMSAKGPSRGTTKPAALSFFVSGRLDHLGRRAVSWCNALTLQKLFCG